MDFEKINIPLASKLTLLYKTTNKIILSFPKHERYCLGERISTLILEALEEVFEANLSNKYEKEKILQKIQSKIELLKILHRLCFELNFFDQRIFLDTGLILTECSKMTTGWLKYTRTLK